MNIWSGSPTQVVPGQDFFPLDLAADVQPAGELEGDALMTELKLDELDIRIARVNKGFNAYAIRLQALCKVLGLEVRCWFASPLKGGIVDFNRSKPGPAPEKEMEFWVHITSPVDKEIQDALAG